ncbi:hypothetical protein SAMN05216419_10452 [Nitrosomonas cryotolerans]|uniref:Uncharacterized protein n=1 Tax=Nitrosomonas cryotolerans ATCC 49181 TaxID=1131553 RepID=A0A1N6FD27_9PROT|nr:hypothetical protein [Nitrosomonas cryotolerans]SFQ00719.1 hypothetical protein SAMN05216419_10452 [Nitrosomonas cryotolerans]SIN93157.1 hypothetical protein SAMN02743940_0201 [Nitrosomonas cryotolerans ATCC 49181]
MTIRNPIDVATRVSPDLSALIETRINNSDSDQPITLATMRTFIAGLLPATFTETEQSHHFDITESLLDELDALIEEFDETTLAIDFVQSVASEPLSRVVETVINSENWESPPTLGKIQEAITSGLLASLVGAGVLEEDEDDALLAEIEGLISRHGVDSLAEEFLRYE